MLALRGRSFFQHQNLAQDMYTFKIFCRLVFSFFIPFISFFFFFFAKFDSTYVRTVSLCSEAEVKS